MLMVTFVSPGGVRARMAAALFNRTAKKVRAVACSLDVPSTLPSEAIAVIGELETDIELAVSRHDGASEYLVALGCDGLDPRIEWPALELDGTIERARAVRDDLLSCIVMLVEKEGWVDSTQLHRRGLP